MRQVTSLLSTTDEAIKDINNDKEDAGTVHYLDEGKFHMKVDDVI
jgi:hypothetical protein